MNFYAINEQDNTLNIRVFERKVLVDPIIITKPYMSLHVVIEQGACAHIIDRVYCSDQRITIKVLSEAALFYYMDGQVNNNTVCVKNLDAVIETNSSLGIISSLTCAGFFSFDCAVTLQGIKAQFFAGSAVLILQQGNYRQHMVQKHVCQDTVSESRLYGIVEMEGSLEHNGLIIIEPIASQSSAQFITKGLSLGPKVKVSAKPMLEIAPKSVFVKHGVAIGPLDKKQMLFLQARGIMPNQATLLLKRAFLAQISSNLPLWLSKIAPTFFLIPI
ncbi:hypothetical protein EKK58_05000 [Candidatus Dependentiae bacterium]|nr:MAG: hypothetical protein EKK58_05000 [Candidatus Dependentiae bacterium]